MQVLRTAHEWFDRTFRQPTERAAALGIAGGVLGASVAVLLLALFSLAEGGAVADVARLPVAMVIGERASSGNVGWLAVLGGASLWLVALLALGSGYGLLAQALPRELGILGGVAYGVGLWLVGKGVLALGASSAWARYAGESLPGWPGLLLGATYGLCLGLSVALMQKPADWQELFKRFRRHEQPQQTS